MIREATREDTPRLIEMAARFLINSRYGEWLPSTPEQISGLIDTVFTLGVIYVAEQPGAILVGMLAVVDVPQAMTGRHYAEEIAWWVEPEHRGGPIWRRLHKAAEVWARNRQLDLKMLSPAGSGLGVYYARLGYVEVETSWIKTL